MQKTFNIKFAILTDGRSERIERSFPTWKTNLDFNLFSEIIIFDSSGKSEYNQYLKQYNATIVSLGKQNLPNAYYKMFKYLNTLEFDYLLFFEDDFCVPKKINILHALSVLRYAQLDQLAFVRQPYYDDEIKSGGVIQYISTKTKIAEKIYKDYAWIEHNSFWTNNPSLISRRVLHVDYLDEIDHENIVGDPTFAKCEGLFFQKLKSKYPDIKLGFYGFKFDFPSVIHYPLTYSNGAIA